MPGLRTLGGGGGTERFFADFHAFYTRFERARFELLMLTDRTALNHLQAAGRVIEPGSVLLVRSASGPLSLAAQALEVQQHLTDVAPDLVHVALPSLRYLPALELHDLWPRGTRPKLCITQPDYTLARAWDDRRLRADPQVKRTYLVYRSYFALLRLDGVFTWYRAFRERAASIAMRGAPLVREARFCFVDTAAFRPAPEKDRTLLWVGRLIASKRPVLFVDTIAALRDRDPQLLKGWQVTMYGKGPLESAVRARIDSHGLRTVVEVTSADQLAPLLARALIYVSTQDTENFTSLAMLEAMACGCAVVAPDVGQTREFVWANRNGRMSTDETPNAIAAAVAGLLLDPDAAARMGECSRNITLEHHCAENFTDDIEGFWDEVLRGPLAAERSHVVHSPSSS